MKSNPAVPGGSLTSKPTWSNAFGCSATSAFFLYVGIGRREHCLEDTVPRPNNLLRQVKGVCLMRRCITSFAILLALIAFRSNANHGQGPRR